EHIRELNAINEYIPQLLTSAGGAINALTNAPLQQPIDSSSSPRSSSPPALPLEARKANFQQHARTYFSVVSRLSDELRTQAAQLEEAGIIPAEAMRLESGGGGGGGPEAEAGGAAGARSRQAAGTTQTAAQVTNGGLGNLDVGWLNSRAGKAVGDKEAKLWDKARELLER
ncbi:mediator complex, subunit Med11, partial [Lineolata rhizophorae]